MTLFLPILPNKPKRRGRGKTWFAYLALETIGVKHHLINEECGGDWFGKNAE